MRCVRPRLSSLTSSAYVRDADGSYRLWVATRAANKCYCPGMLDATAGGGLASGEAPLEAVVRETFEEASISPELCRSGLRPTGVTSILSVNAGEIVANLNYTFDLPLTAEIVPRPNDAEVERFDLFTVDELIEALFERRVMPGARAVLRTR